MSGRNVLRLILRLPGEQGGERENGVSVGHATWLGDPFELSALLERVAPMDREPNG